MLPTPASAPVHDRSLDHYARLVRRLLRVPVALVTLVDEHDQVLAGAAGLSDADARASASHSFCRFVLSSGNPLVVDDARRDTGLAEHPAVRRMGVVAYAGWPLYDQSGDAVGSLCAIEHGARAWTTDEVSVLQDLARACGDEVQRGSTLTTVLDQLAALERDLEPAMAHRVATIRRSAIG
jgi:GAF domain-containing protein